MRRTGEGFTLIELLIVVTIMAILAGAAIPYVQQYVDESRVARAKSDMTGYKDLLALWETKRSETYISGNLQQLMDSGYVTKISADPWGAPYYVSTASVEIGCAGEDGVSGTADDMKMVYGPKLAVSGVYWIDANSDGVVSDGDALNFHLTRAADPSSISVGPGVDDWEIVGSPASVTSVSAANFVNNNRVASYALVLPVVGPLKIGGSTRVAMKSTSLVKEFGVSGKAVVASDPLKIQVR